MILPNQRHLFDIPDDIAYLNCGYMSPLLRHAITAGAAGLARKAHPWEVVARDFFADSDRLRADFARLINARPLDIALVPSVGYGISTAARNLPLAAGQNVVVAAGQFPSNFYPWRERARETGATVRSVDQPATGSWTDSVLAAIDDATAVVAVPQCHWTDGRWFDLERIGEACRRRGAALSLDITQTLGVIPFDVEHIQPDFMSCTGYKWLLSPYSMGYLYVAERWQQGQPIEQNWMTRKNAEDFARLVDYQDEYEPGARRYDVGETANFALLPAAGAALLQVLDWGVSNIRDTLEGIADSIVERVRPLGLTALPKGQRAPHYLGLQCEGGMPPGLLPALAERKVFVSVRGASVRVTPYLYNTPEDVDRFVEALEAAL